MLSLTERVLPPVIAIAALVGLWSLATGPLGVPAYLLPAPTRVLQALWSALADGTLAIHAWATLKTLFLGYIAGCIAALAISLAITQVRWVERLLVPLITGIQAIPKVALAPLLFIWIGFGQPAIVTLTALTCYFPVLINAVSGLRSTDPDLDDLYATYRAGPLRRFFEVKLPGAARQIFAGLELALVFALIGNVVMEFLVGSEGLGYLIQESANSADLPLNFAAVISLGFIGIVLSRLLVFVRVRVLYWRKDAA
jgi:NitT/TauT family transport system permease protein